MIATPPDIHPEGRYSAIQAAHALGLHRCTLYRLANEGVLKPRYEKRTGRVRFRGKDLLAYWRAEF